MKRKVRILHLLHSFSCGGMENGVVSIANFMDSEKFTNIICSFTTSDDYQYRIHDERRIVYNLLKKEGNDLSIPGKIASIIKREKVDIVHSRGWGTYVEGIIAAKLLCRHVKFVFSFHGMTIEELENIPKRRVIIQKILFFFIDDIMTLSNHMAKQYATLIKIKKSLIKVIYNGVDQNKFSKENINSDKIDQMKKEFGIEKQDFVIGFVGRIDPVKGLTTLIDAVGVAGEAIPCLKLFIVGEGSSRVSLQNYVKEKKLTHKVIFAGQKENIAECLSFMDLYVQPSLYEGMSNTILEAMMMEKVVLATKAGGNVELIDHNHDGILFLPKDHNDLARHIQDLYHNPDKSKKLASEGYEKAKELFSMSSMIKNYENFYIGLMN